MIFILFYNTIKELMEGKMKKNLKRIGAYILDSILISLVAVLLSNITFINKNYKEYNKTYDEFIKFDSSYQEFSTELKNSYKDNKITEEEYNLLSKNTDYSNSSIKKYVDKELSKKTIEKINNEISKKYVDTVIEYNYDLSKLNIISTVITLICILIYFVVVQYFMDGQTLGKRIFSLKVVTKENGKVNFKHLFLRTIILTGVLLNVLKVVILYTLSSKDYYNVNYYLSLLGSAVEFIILFMISYRSDSRGLHDIVGGTKVIDLNNDAVNSEKIIEAEFNEK